MKNKKAKNAKKQKMNELEIAIRKDIMTGVMPIPLNRASLEGAIEFGKHRGGPSVSIACHQCKSTKKDRYSALITSNRYNIKLECIDCLVEVAKEQKVKIYQVTRFIDARYMGACEACSYIQNL